MQRLVREIDGIETVDALRDVLADVPGDRPIRDVFGDPLKFEFLRDDDTGDEEIAVS